MEKKALLGARFNVRQITVVGILSSLSIVLGMTPLGFIPIPPVNATIMHIPVIIGAILEGPIVGAMIGLIFGIFSAIRAITNPSAVSFVFLNPIVSVLPRVLVGITSYYVFNIIKSKNTSLKIAAGAIVGSLTNTIGVLGFIYLIYLKSYANALGVSVTAAQNGIISVGVINGIPEAIISMLVVVPVIKIINKMRK